MFSVQYPLLFSPFTVREMTLWNRVVMPPMGTNFAPASGEMTPPHIRYYERRAMGGCGLIIVENANVSFPEGGNGTTQLRLDHDRLIPRFYELCEAVHRHGARIALQINHAGASARQSLTGAQPVSASDVPSRKGGDKPRPLSREEIDAIVLRYGEAAARARQAGFDAVEVHAGHGYLLNQFLSPFMNRRTDEFGGTPENRSRLARMVLEEVRHRVGPRFPVFLRISADEMVPEGNSLDDTIALLEFFHAEADVIDVSAGLAASVHYQLDSCDLPDGWRSYMAKAVRQALGKPTLATGNIRSPRAAEAILAGRDADLVGIGRGHIADPDWADKTLCGKEETIRACISCNIGCASHRNAHCRPIRCTVNPDVVASGSVAEPSSPETLNVVVVGGGTAGLEAACTAAEAGCITFLIEKRASLGGLAEDIASIPDKERVGAFPCYLRKRAASLGNLFVFTGTDATPELVERFKPDLVVNATGAIPLLPPIPGLAENVDAAGGRVFSIAGLLARLHEIPHDLAGKRAVIVGGGAVGIDVAEMLAPRNAAVTVVEMLPDIGSDLEPVGRARMEELFAKHNVTIRTGTALAQVNPRAFAVTGPKGEKEELPFDFGFVCLGMKARSPVLAELEERLRPGGVEFVAVGDAVRAGRIIDGVAGGRNILETLKRMQRLRSQ